MAKLGPATSISVLIFLVAASSARAPERVDGPNDAVSQPEERAARHAAIAHAGRPVEFARSGSLKSIKNLLPIGRPQARAGVPACAPAVNAPLFPTVISRKASPPQGAVEQGIDIPDAAVQLLVDQGDQAGPQRRNGAGSPTKSS